MPANGVTVVCLRFMCIFYPIDVFVVVLTFHPKGFGSLDEHRLSVQACGYLDYHLHGLAFGLVWAVLTFNRYSAFISALARRWLAIPCTNFKYDFKVHTTAHDEGSASHYFNRLMAKAGLGWRFDASKDHIPALKCRFLVLGRIIRPLLPTSGRCHRML